MRTHWDGAWTRASLHGGVRMGCLWAAQVLLAQAPPTWEDLEARGARLASIDLRIGDVFDPSLPKEDHWIGRTANFLHLETRKRVVQRELPFRPGDLVNARQIHEAERVLRTFRFLKDARIEPRVDESGAVHAVVRTWDAWTLMVSGGFSQVGGQRDAGFSLHEANFLGFGKDLVFEQERTPERTIRTITYLDRQVLGSQWTLNARYQSLSDGKTRLLEFARPYRGLETPWSLTVQASSTEALRTVYNLQRAAYAFQERRERALLAGSWALSVSGGRAHRLGGGLEVLRTRSGPLATLDRGLLPAPRLSDRRLQGLHLSWALFEDRFRPFVDLAGMTHPEDYNLGWEVQVSLGSHLRSLGSEADSPFLRARASKGWTPGAGNLVLLRAGASVRRESRAWRDGFLDLGLMAYHQGFPRQTQAACVRLDAVHRPEPEGFLYLGGMEGLRGYANHLLVGDRRWIASLEERINTPYDWLGILRLGFVAYVDVGAIRRTDTGRWSRTYANVGGGLRLGNLKSSIGRVFLMTVAIPLVREPGMERRQFVVGNLVSF